ncbi:alcohol dehydrogenase [Clostridium carboxidivorans P7]|uniref:Iron-containing alcohol dehydrogenase n=1 Tax=Clostridium carboxidivorans P7 TaxID=536227 RepID=C6PUD8_9CLOT|nr:1-propanol dehydrogenase PduQ [Clostridium carboxidivorans]AKN30561.1 alcohol dehydrogenase [Clostridium carboxidivorans P7]EET87136.1 iron-containing alcohol dehydrogenase [Clostridium carboxidivorans P7]EFG86307.1 putative NADPH-dependent butanol dehydrogenase [Clostridium carboxidivorans P7]
MKKFKVPCDIYYEDGAINYLESLKCNKVFIVTDGVMVKVGMLDKIKEIFEKQHIDYKIFSEIEPEPSLEVVTKGLEIFSEYGAETLIAVGGGSVIDASKAIIYLLKEMLKKTSGGIKNHTHFIAIPTTSGTGSEVSSYAVITDKRLHKKIALQSEEMYPDVAILDCDFTKTVPPSVTADTGMDVLTHAIEAFVSKRGSDCTSALAKMAIEYVFKYIERVYNTGMDKISREKMHSASCMAGISFENSSLGINHSMAHILGAKFKIPHGKANAILLPYVIKYNSGLFDEKEYISFDAAEKYSDIARLVGLPQANIKEGVIMLMKAIKVLNRKLNIPICISELGIDENEFLNSLKEMCKVAMEDVCTQGNPRTPNEDDICSIFKEAYYGK